MPKLAPYGSWKSPITSDLIASETLGLEQIALDGSDIYWIELSLWPEALKNPYFNDKWGIVDVDDCVNGALTLAERGDVDGNRLIIRGGSAGGYTKLGALTFRSTFKVGASYYGISDLEVLAKETHKFESRYLDRLVGPYPERREFYRERSPIYFSELLSCPVIFFQDREDKIVPPNQARMMFDALRTKGLLVALVEFDREQHGFRRAENIKRALDAELYFYSRIFNFQLADFIEPVPIENI